MSTGLCTTNLQLLLAMLLIVLVLMEIVFEAVRWYLSFELSSFTLGERKSARSANQYCMRP